MLQIALADERPPQEATERVATVLVGIVDDPGARNDGALPGQRGTSAQVAVSIGRARPRQSDLARAMLSVFVRDLQGVSRRRADTAAALLFFVIVTSLFPLGVGADPALLRTMAPGVVWVAALLASMLSLARLYADDHRDGTLEQLLLAPVPLPLLVLAKTAAHWLTSGLLLAVVAPLLALQFGLAPPSIAVLTASLVVGTPLLSLIGGIGAALTVGVRGTGVLLSLVVLPLVMPVLIFGAGAVAAADAGLGMAAQFSLLGALLALALVLAPLASAAALRIALD